MLRVSLPTLGACGGRYRLDELSGYGKGKRNCLNVAVTGNSASKRRKLGISSRAESRDTSRADFYKEIRESARNKFTKEVSLQSPDKDISLAKALLYIAAEDEAFLAFNHEIDTLSIDDQRKKDSSDRQMWKTMEDMPLAEKIIDKWIAELDAISKEVEIELVSREIGCYLVEVLEAVNKVLFESRGFKRSTEIVDSKCWYLHSALSSGCASGILLNVIYIEVCRRLNLTIVGSPVGEEFLIWPLTGNPEELFKVTSGKSLFGIINGNCVDDPRRLASDIDSNSLLGLEIANNRDIIGIALANLIRLYWKSASKANPGLMLNSPLRPVHKCDEKLDNEPLLRPRELRLAIMASERLLHLQLHNWTSRRDYGMMLYYNRDYEEAVQELSICMAFAPEDEAKELEPFVEKLHLIRLETSWKSIVKKDQLRVP